MILTGGNLDRISEIDFGVDINVKTMEKIGSSRIDLEISVEDYAQIGHRLITAYPEVEEENGR